MKFLLRRDSAAAKQGAFSSADFRRWTQIKKERLSHLRYSYCYPSFSCFSNRVFFKPLRAQRVFSRYKSLCRSAVFAPLRGISFLVAAVPRRVNWWLKMTKRSRAGTPNEHQWTRIDLRITHYVLRITHHALLFSHEGAQRGKAASKLFLAKTRRRKGRKKSVWRTWRLCGLSEQRERAR
jgi:hypothetical protein